MSKDVELILVDDGSDDKCPIICDEYAFYKENIKVIHKKNGGLVSAVKAGIIESRGEYIGFCDGDDYVDALYIKSILDIINKYNTDIILFDFYRVIYGTDIKNVEESVLIPQGLSNGEGCIDIRNRYMERGGISPCRWNKVIKRELVDRIMELYDDRINIGEDIVFTAPLIYSMRSVYYIDKPLIYYNINPDSMTQSFNKNYLKDYNLIYEILSQFFKSDKAFLSHIYYVNMRTLVNSVSKSNMKRKASYLKAVFSDDEIRERLKYLDTSRLPFGDRVFYTFMKSNKPSVLLLMASVYRKVK
jgi:glycosyltransferase involved in cell wall biosynthesis